MHRLQFGTWRLTQRILTTSYNVNVTAFVPPLKPLRIGAVPQQPTGALGDAQQLAQLALLAQAQQQQQQQQMLLQMQMGGMGALGGGMCRWCGLTMAEIPLQCLPYRACAYHSLFQDQMLVMAADKRSAAP